MNYEVVVKKKNILSYPQRAIQINLWKIILKSLQ